MIKLCKDIPKEEKENIDKLLYYYFRIKDNDLKNKLIDMASFMCNMEKGK